MNLQKNSCTDELSIYSPSSRLFVYDFFEKKEDLIDEIRLNDQFDKNINALQTSKVIKCSSIESNIFEYLNNLKIQNQTDPRRKEDIYWISVKQRLQENSPQKGITNVNLLLQRRYQQNIIINDPHEKLLIIQINLNNEIRNL